MLTSKRSKKNNPDIMERPLYEWALLITLSLLVILIYSKALNGAFVFDDLRLILHNSQIRLTEFTFANLRRVVSSPRPVAMLSIALNYYFHQYEVVGYHLVNIAIHLATGFFLYFFLKNTLRLPSLRDRYSGTIFLPFIATAIWLVHPVHTQSVSYIIQRMNSLAAMFFILSMLLYLKARTSENNLLKLSFNAGCILAGLLALGSKEMAATLPFFIFLYEWYFFQDLNWAWFRKSCLLLITVILLLGLLVYFNPQFIPFGIIKSGYDLYDFTMLQRVLTESRVVIYYLGLLIFPHPGRLNLDYDFPLSHSLLTPPTTLLSIAAIAGALFVAFYIAGKNRLLSFCIIWFFGTLAIESSIIPLDIIFEHRLYLPSMLPILGVIILCRQYLPYKRLKIILLITVLSIYAFWTEQRNAIWGDPLALFIDCANKSQTNPRPAYNTACEFAKRGNADQAVYWLKKTVSKKGFSRWDLIKYDKDLDKIRESRQFKKFLNYALPDEK